MNCNVCNYTGLDQVLYLPNYPLNTIFLAKAEYSKEEKYNPKDFSLYTCTKCGHFQAISGIKLSDLYNDAYNYNTQNSGVQGRISFFLSQLDKIESIDFNRVIDVGCFDLSLLKSIKHRIKAKYFIGIDPSIPNKCLTNEDGIVCFKDYIDNVEIPYFNEDLPDLIISDQTLEHIPTISSTLGNIFCKVSKGSIFAVCVPSLEVLVEKLNFHNLIHEHVNYFSIQTLAELFRINNLSLQSFTLNYTSTCGFLFGIFIKDDLKQKKILLNENKFHKEFFLKQYYLFKSFLVQTEEIIADLKNEKIYGFGASDITANLAYFMNSDFAFMKNILDDTDYKQGKFFPFLKPQIRSENGIGDLSESNCLLTAPQAARYLYPRINKFNFKKIINPIGLIS